MNAISPVSFPDFSHPVGILIYLLAALVNPLLEIGRGQQQADGMMAQSYLRQCAVMLEATLADDPRFKLSTFAGKTCENAPAPKAYKVPPSTQIIRSSIEVDSAKNTYQITVWTIKGQVWRTDSDFKTVKIK